MRHWHLPVLFLVWVALANVFSARGNEAAERSWIKGRDFSQALEAPVSVFRKRAELREMLTRLAEVRQTAFVLDRRVDPSQSVSVKLSRVPLLTAFHEIATQAHCETGTLGSTLLVGHPEELDRLLTLAEVKRNELKQQRTISSIRRVQLLRERNLIWNDLDRPLDVLAQIEQVWNLQIQGRSSVPHDLWAGGQAIEMDAVEALSLILGQYDLTFTWEESGAAVRIIPAPSDPTILRTHRPVKMTATAGLALVQQNWPELTVQRTTSGLKIQASFKQHEAISRLLGELPRRKTVEIGEPVPLSRRRFPVKIVRKPFAAVVQALNAQGITVHCDLKKLQQRGIDVETLVTLEFENATAEEFFQALCQPVGLSYEIDGAEVTIFPKSRSDKQP